MNLQNIFNKKRIIYLFLRSPDGKLSLKKDSTFYPYYYEPIKYGLPEEKGKIYKSYEGKKLVKRVVNEPGEVPALRGKDSYEADIVFANRYLLDRVDKLDKTYIKYLFLDIEVNHPEYEYPEPKTALHPIVSITIYNSMYKKIRNWFINDYEGDLQQKEIQLLRDFITYIRKAKPDLLVGWYCEDFDYPLLYHRFERMPKKYFSKFFKNKYNNNFATTISPIGEARSGGRKSEIYDVLYPAGISIIDYLQFYKFIYKNERSYALNDVMQKVLGKGKEFKDVDFSKITEIVKKRNIEDVKGMIEIEKKLQLIPYWDEIRRIAKVKWEDLKYPLRIIDSLFLQVAKEKGVILPMSKRGARERLEGAYRELFKSGVFFNNVGLYDLSGAYLNTVVDLCLDSTNIVSEIGDDKVIPVNITDRKSREVLATHLVKQNPGAMFPTVAKKLLSEKQRLKDLKKTTDPSSPEYKDIEQKYDSFKGIVLSSWGVMSNPYFRLFDERVGNLITSTVRDLLYFIKDELKKLNYEVIYIDTDGIMIDDGGKNINDLLNVLIQEWSEKRFGKKSSIEFEYAGHFKSLLIVALCHYKGNLIRPDGKIKEEMKGIEAKRRDSTLFMARFQDTLINKILNKESKTKIIKWIKEQMKEIKKVPLEEISFPASLKQKIEDYKTVVTNKKGTTYTKKPPVHIQAIQNTQKVIPKFNKRIGELYHWVYLEGKVPFAFDEKIAKSYNLDIDWDFTIERNIMNKVKTIFKACNWSFELIKEK